MPNCRRRETVYRAFRLIQMFQERQRVTVPDLMYEFSMCKQNAQRWINEASRVLPIIEVGEETVYLANGNVAANKRKVYGLMK